MKLHRSKLLIALLFIVMIIPGLGYAAPYLYTYTGNLITSTNPELEWKYMDNPDGNFIKVQFIYNGEDINPWTFSEQSVENFNISLGSVKLFYNGLIGTASNAALTVYNRDYITQLPTRWHASINTIVPGNDESYGLLLQTSYGSFDTEDHQYINEWRCDYYYDPAIGGPVNNQSFQVNLPPGEWKRQDASAVPLPASIILLWSGLAGLAGFRRKFKKA